MKKCCDSDVVQAGEERQDVLDIGGWDEDHIRQAAAQGWKLVRRLGKNNHFEGLIIDIYEGDVTSRFENNVDAMLFALIQSWDNDATAIRAMAILKEDPSGRAGVCGMLTCILSERF